MNLVDIGRKTKIACYVGMILRWVIAIGDETDAQVLARLQLARLKDVFADELDVFCRRRNVGPLTACAVLDKDEIAARPTPNRNCWD